MVTFNDFVQEIRLKNKATSNIEIHQVLPSLILSDVGLYLRDRLFEFDIGIVILQPSKRTQWFCYTNESF